MSGQKKDPLCIVSLKVLEDWAMMLTDQVEPTTCQFAPEKELFMSWVDIDGEVVQGALSIVAQEEFMKALAMNLLGCEEVPCMEECMDAFREMANVLAGNFFTTAFGDDVVFRIVNPNVSKVPFSDLEKITQRRSKHFFMADQYPVAITFSIKS